MMKHLIKYMGSIVLFALLTLISQVGGLIYLACIPLFRYLRRFIKRPIWRIAANIGSFSFIYTLIALYIIPVLAIWSGRVPLPTGDENPNLKQWNWLMPLLNRHYVTPELLTVTEGVANKMAAKYEGTVTTYLESGFPFFEDYPMWPHLSHSNGRKIDLSFYYTDIAEKKPSNDRPSWLGYGVSEEPRAGEEDRPGFCDEKGYWQYNFMRKYLIPQGKKQELSFDANRTRDMVRYFLNDIHVQLVLIEPHLKSRLGFQKENKIRLHPCESVRHDDHVHIAIY